MPTIKDVTIKILTNKDPGLAAYYNEFRKEADPSIKGYRVQEIFHDEVDFWINELKNLPLEKEIYQDTVWLFHEETGFGRYFEVFENSVLPLLLTHWKFEED